MSRRQRLRALDLERVLILDRGNVELALPRGWTVERDPEGHLACKDPTDACKLEVSYLGLPEMPPDAPSMVERVVASLEGVADPATCSPPIAFRRGDVDCAWTDYTFTSEDSTSSGTREAHGRLLLAANRWFQLVLTFSYWTDDTAWAVPVWERIVETIELSDGVPMETPRDHWSLQDP